MTPDNTIEETSVIPMFEEREIGTIQRKRVKVISHPLTQAEARRVFPYRPVSDNVESRFGGNELTDDICLLLNDLARCCKMCRAPTRNIALEDGVCPDCDGRSEYNGKDPHKK